MGPNHIEYGHWIEYGSAGDSYVKKMDEVRAVSSQNANEELTDSAAAGTALATGVLTENGYVGQDKYGKIVQNLFEYINKAHPDYKTGVIAKVHAGHATPASFLGHSVSRKNDDEIYETMLEHSNVSLVITPGHPSFDKFKSDFANYFTIIDPDQIKANISVLADTKLPYIATTSNPPQIEMKNFIDCTTDDLNLEKITFAALERLNGGPFALMIEASKVDLGSHDNNATYLVGEMIEADRLIRQLMHYIDIHPEKNIQLIVCADHETGGVAIVDDFSNLKSEIPRSFDSVEVQNQKRIQRINEMPNISFRSDYHSNMFTIAAGYGSYFDGTKMKDVYRTPDLYYLARSIIDQKKAERKLSYKIQPENSVSTILNSKQKIILGFSIAGCVGLVGTIVGLILLK